MHGQRHVDRYVTVRDNLVCTEKAVVKDRNGMQAPRLVKNSLRTRNLSFVHMQTHARHFSVARFAQHECQNLLIKFGSRPAENCLAIRESLLLFQEEEMIKRSILRGGSGFKRPHPL